METAGNKKYLYFFGLIDYIYQSVNFHQILFVPFIVSALPTANLKNNNNKKNLENRNILPG